ncbi:hypothetical protein A2U01_0050899, partial [Trifolium medium]|nr:hypothetical protein [Trifolium medium]
CCCFDSIPGFCCVP